MKHLHEALPFLNDPLIQFILLQACFAFPKFPFSLRRTTDTSVHREVWQEFDGLVHQALERILGAPLMDPQWDQASLPVSKGGFGLWGAEATAHEGQGYGRCS